MSEENDNGAEAQKAVDKERLGAGLEFAQTLFAGVDLAGPQSMPERLGELTLRHLFGDLWQGDELTKQQRSLITCSILVALNRTEEQHLHFVGAKNMGISREAMEGMITHSAYYAGWPCAVSAARVLNDVWPADA